MDERLAAVVGPHHGIFSLTLARPWTSSVLRTYCPPVDSRRALHRGPCPGSRGERSLPDQRRSRIDVQADQIRAGSLARRRPASVLERSLRDRRSARRREPCRGVLSPELVALSPVRRSHSLSDRNVVALGGARRRRLSPMRARCGLSQAGSALAAVSFTLCGFQAAHIVHEPFNQLMPYLPLCLLLGGSVPDNRQARLAGRPGAGLGQLSSRSGIFKSRCGPRAWSSCRAPGGCGRSERAGKVHSGAVAACCAGLFWGLLIAWVQFRLTWELTGVSGFVRPPHLMAAFSFPPAHWAQFALPEVFLGAA